MMDDNAPPPQPKTTVPEDAVKITQNVVTGEFGIETGAKANPKVIEELTRKLTAKAGTCKSNDADNNVEKKEQQKGEKAAQMAKKAQAENAEQDKKDKARIEEAKKDAKIQEDKGKERVAAKERQLKDLEAREKQQKQRTEAVKDRAEEAKVNA